MSKARFRITRRFFPSKDYAFRSLGLASLIFAIPPEMSKAETILPDDQHHQQPANATAAWPKCGSEQTFKLERPGKRIRAGVLQRPNGRGPFPTAILLPGSGLHDRDSTIAGYPFFQALSASLCKHGIASIRLDDPGTGQSDGNKWQMTIQQLLADIQAAETKANTIPWVDHQKIGLIGHSEGGMFTYLLGQQLPQANFLVLMSAPARPFSVIVPLQFGNAEEQGVTPQNALAIQSRLTTLLTELASQPNENERTKRVQAFEEEVRKEKQDSEWQSFWRQLLSSDWKQRLLSPWMYSQLKTTQAFIDESIRAIPQRVLILQGSTDVQVNPKQDAGRLDRLMTQAGIPHKTMIFNNLDHLYGVNPTGSQKNYGRDWSQFENTVLPIISGWIHGLEPATRTNPHENQAE